MGVNREEVFVGAVIALSFLYFASFISIPMCAILWALGGTYNKNFRRIGVPIVLCGLMALNTRSWLPLISIIPMHLVLRIGYGVPDGSDMGSDLGQWWTRKLTNLKKPYIQITTKQMEEIDIFVRFTIALLIGLSLLPLAFINLIHYILGVTLICLSVPLVVNVVE